MAQHASIAFDTLHYAKKLQKAGFTEIQAETQVEGELIDDSLATKVDIRRLEEGIKVEIKHLDERITISEERTSERISNMGYKTMIGLGSMIAAGITVLGVLLKQSQF
jgi:hypothetical protein